MFFPTAKRMRFHIAWSNSESSFVKKSKYHNLNRSNCWNCQILRTWWIDALWPISLYKNGTAAHPLRGKTALFQPVRVCARVCEWGELGFLSLQVSPANLSVLLFTAPWSHVYALDSHVNGSITWLQWLQGAYCVAYAGKTNQWNRWGNLILIPCHYM